MTDNGFAKIKEEVVERLLSQLDERLVYHNKEHTLDVLEATERYARDEGVNGDRRLLLRTAALFHDLGFLERYENNESKAAALARRRLGEFGFTAGQIKAIAGMILATRLPQRPTDPLERILCDADLDYLGREDFEEQSRRLRREMAFHGIAFSEREWLLYQAKFLKDHVYYTESARRTREADKQTRLKEILARVGNAKTE
jgi:predicted metal-dependent HD superfamily phosphohydrolase